MSTKHPSTARRGDGSGGAVKTNGHAAPNAPPLFTPGTDGARPRSTRSEPLGVGPSPPVVRQAGPVVRPSRVAIAQVELTLAKHRPWLESLPGVLGVRRGYKVTDGWISTTPCIVVIVKHKTPNTPLEIPAQLDGVLVDVAPATPRQQLLSLSPEAKKAVSLSLGLDAEEVVRTSRYEPPPHLRLDAVESAMSVLCHTSPDAGWPTLKRFLSGITQRATIGMYDFTAPHIRKQLIASMKSVRGDLRIVVDPKLSLGSPGEGNNPKANDETEDDVRADLDNAIGERLFFTWAAVKLEGKTTKGIFPSAYHIKLVVRDGLDFWLSSGNWQSSNQPDLDPLGADRSEPHVLDVYNREWHVVVGHRGLAQVFEQYLEWDMEQATPLQVEPETAVLPDLAVKPLPEAEVALVAPRFFAPKEFRFTPEQPLRVQPLLSPDNYAEHALALVRAARRRLYIQNQYIKTAKQNTREFAAILDGIKKAISDRVDVRIIVRDLPDVRAQLEALLDDGFDMECIRVLRGTHTKGVIVDSSTVMIGSHNWSNDGVLYNRDASLVFHDAGIAKFYEEIFLYDWGRARHKMSYELAMPFVLGQEEAAPSGYDTVRWTDIYDG